MTPSRPSETGCAFGRATRSIALILPSIFIGIVSAVAWYSVDTRADLANIERAQTVTIGTVRDRILANATLAARVDERLAAMEKRLERIEAAVNR